MTGTFIVSLDCEGKWGMADMIGPEHSFITEASLVDAYERLIDAFARFDLKATFAFVGAFTLTEDERKSHRDCFQDVLYEGRNWLRHYREAEAAGTLDGWFCPAALDMARARGHEIASHGFLHVPFDDPATPREALARDLRCAVSVARDKGVELETFVYPRNRIAHTDILLQSGFVGYRGNLPSRNRLHSLSRELNILGKSQKDTPAGQGILEVPAGYFFNWRQGPRKLVPRRATLARWSSILDDAANRSGVAHLWLHPHNIIDAPDTFDVLLDVLGRAARLRDAGQLRFATQASYLSQFRAGTAGTAS